jgi:hypothetical protein
MRPGVVECVNDRCANLRSFVAEDARKIPISEVAQKVAEYDAVGLSSCTDKSLARGETKQSAKSFWPLGERVFE